MSESPFEGWWLPGGPAAPAPEVRRLEPGGARLAWLPLDRSGAEAVVTGVVQAGGELARIPVRDVAGALGRVGSRFADPSDPLRVEALARLPAHAGVSPEQARWVLDGMAVDWTPERLGRLLEEEFGDPEVLDGFRWSVGRRLRARAGRLSLHVGSGTVPGVSLTSLVRGLLVKGAVLLKPGARDTLLPVLFARALRDEGPVGEALAAACAVAYWPGGHGALEDVALERADAVVAYGSDDTVVALRARARAGARVVVYPHRLSLVVISPEAAVEGVAGETARDVAQAVASFDQRGCVCPHQVFVTGDDGSAARRFGEALAVALERLASTLPPGAPDPDEASAVHQLRGTVELRRSGEPGLWMAAGPGVAWTVIVDPEPRFRASCLSRTVHVTPVRDLETLAEALGPVRRHLQSAGVAGFEGSERATLDECLARAGVTRIVPVQALAFPPAWWLHDGRGPLRDLVLWTESVGAEPPPGS